MSSIPPLHVQKWTDYSPGHRFDTTVNIDPIIIIIVPHGPRAYQPFEIK